MYRTVVASCLLVLILAHTASHAAPSHRLTDSLRVRRSAEETGESSSSNSENAEVVQTIRVASPSRSRRRHKRSPAAAIMTAVLNLCMHGRTEGCTLQVTDPNGRRVKVIISEE